MPTGYTADVADGKVTDFRTFALRCARQFGATIMQRDDPMDEPPKLREESPYAAEALAKAKAHLLEVNAMTVKDAERKAEAEYKRLVRERQEADEHQTEIRNRYNAMLADVQAWEPPTSKHAGLKKFMIEQLVESRKFDTNSSWPWPERQSGAEWLKAARAKARRDVEYYTKEVEEEHERVAGANAWIRALYDSLPTEAKA